VNNPAAEGKASSVCQGETQDAPEIRAVGLTSSVQIGDRAAIHPRMNVSSMVEIGLAVCLITLLLGTSVFVVSAASGSTAGYYLGYMGGAFRRFTLYLQIPLWVAASVFAISTRSGRAGFHWPRLLPVIFFWCLAFMQLAFADRFQALPKIEMLLEMIPVILLALPLYSQRGCHLFWLGLMTAGLLFFVSLLLSGQLVSVFSGGGLRGLEVETSDRLDLGVDTITSASVMCQCVLAAVLWLSAQPRKIGFWLAGIPVCACLFGTALLTGSKGPILSLVVALAVASLIRGSKRTIIGLLAVGGVVAVLWAAIQTAGYYAGSTRHLDVGFDDRGRASFYEFVVRSVPTLFGNGVGSFTVNNGFEIGGYVHNSILEAYYEMGGFGAALFLWAVGSVGLFLCRVVRAHRDPVAGFILAYFSYGLAFSMVSGSIFGDTTLWLGTIFACAWPTRRPDTKCIPVA
jgi:hypothetical protein